MSTDATAIRPHVYLLIDRSGSMASMVDDVIGGFNTLLADQQADGPDARMTVVQFDSQDAHEVIADAVRIAKVQPLDRQRYVPRGGTPLLDATGRIINRAAVREHERRVLGKRPEAITVVTITDGLENQSREYSRTALQALMRDKQAAGWTFGFIGAGIDAYAEAGAMGYDPRSVQVAAADGPGQRAAWGSTSRALRDRRRRLRAGDAVEAADFFLGTKEAEADLHRRTGS